MTGEQAQDRAGDLLAQIEQVLQRQLDRLAGNDLDGLESLIDRGRTLMAQLPGAGLEAGRHAERVRRIAQLDAKVGLALAQKREELSDTLRHRRRGRAVLGAYRRALS